MFFKKLSLSVIMLLTCVVIFADEFRLADIFSDHVVLQQGKPVPVWGWAEPGTKVSVEFKGQNLSAVTYKNGKWLVKLKAMNADSKPADMTISHRSDKRIIKDILVGEVWICSGQSNMEWHVARSKQGKKMVTNAKNSRIRLFKIPRRTAASPINSINAKWQLCSPESVAGFSAVGYYFGLELFKELNVPIGLIQSAWGGTSIEPWTPPVGFAMVNQTKPILDKIAKANKKYQEDMKKHLPYMAQWLKQAQKNTAENKDIDPIKNPFPGHKLNSHRAPTGLYNAMIAPLVPFAIRGVIWYQGENNVSDGTSYFYKMKALINGWRKVWHQKDFPFYFVQIAPYQYGRNQLSLLWQAQYRTAREIRNCDLVFPGDVGNIRDIHPRRKYPVGKRLAMLALTNDYGRKIIDAKSPAFKGLKVENGKLIISFNNLNTSLKTSDGKEPAEFMIAGNDHKYYPAQAEIKGKTIIISSEKVKDPVSAKYAWHNLAVPNLVNDKGIPVLPFVTTQNSGNLALNKTYISSDKNPWGWDKGLTDGSWGVTSASCFATKNSDKFPKYVTVDLTEKKKIKKIILGVPPFGSTKTVKIESSVDGNNFKLLKTVEFVQGKTENKVLEFPAFEVRFLRLKFPDYHKRKVIYDPRYIFITEFEVY